MKTLSALISKWVWTPDVTIQMIWLDLMCSDSSVSAPHSLKTSEIQMKSRPSNSSPVSVSLASRAQKFDSFQFGSRQNYKCQTFAGLKSWTLMKTAEIRPSCDWFDLSAAKTSFFKSLGKSWNCESLKYSPHCCKSQMMTLLTFQNLKNV